MAFLSRGTRFLMDKLADDYLYFKSNSGKLRSFDGDVDPRSWSTSDALRHQHLVDVVTEKGVRSGMGPVSKECSSGNSISLSSDSYCTCIQRESRSCTLSIKVLPSELSTKIEIRLPNEKDFSKLIEENQRLRIKLQQYRKQEQQYVQRLEELRYELTNVLNN